MGLICVGEFSRLPSLVMLMNSENHGQISKLPVLLNLEEKLLYTRRDETQHTICKYSSEKNLHIMVGSRSGAAQLGHK